MAALSDLETALRNADAAGDVEAARTLAGAITQLRKTQAEAKPEFTGGALGSAALGAADTATFGFGDELAAGLGALSEGAASYITGKEGRSYDEILKQLRGQDERAQEANPGSYLTGQIAGGVGQGLGLARGGLSLAANAAGRGAGLGRIAAASAADGAIMGGVQGVGSGEGAGGRLLSGVTGASAGLALGAGVPLAVAGGSSALQTAAAPILSRIRPADYADRALEATLRRSGQTPEAIERALSNAAADGQNMFTVADALGHAGQRSLSAVTRTPNDARQEVVNRLVGRQVDQGRRVAGALSDASGSPLTASQYKELLEKARATRAGVDYGPVKTDTTPINVSDAVALANKSISPAADNVANAAGAVPTDLAARESIEAGEGSIRDPIRALIKDARSYLASNRSTVTNVEKAFRAKTNIDMMIASATANNQGAAVVELMPIQKALDDALARTSKTYEKARDAYSLASSRIDAVDIGREMASPRTRVDDNLSTFGALLDEEAQRSARVGYFDPLINRAERQAGTLSDSSRPFISEASRRELPEFAAPERGDKLMRQLGREQQMFQTSNAALGGSKTAENLADAAELKKFDPSIVAQIATGHWSGAAMSAISRVVSEVSGVTPQVAERFARALIETNPQAAREMLTRVQAAGRSRDAIRGNSLAALLGVTSAGTGRLAAP